MWRIHMPNWPSYGRSVKKCGSGTFQEFMQPLMLTGQRMCDTLCKLFWVSCLIHMVLGVAALNFQRQRIVESCIFIVISLLQQSAWLAELHSFLLPTWCAWVGWGGKGLKFFATVGHWSPWYFGELHISALMQVMTLWWLKLIRHHELAKQRGMLFSV